MAKRKKKKSGIQDKHTAPLLLQSADRGTDEFREKHALEPVKTDLGGTTLRVCDKRPIDTYYRIYRGDMERGIAEKNCRGINEEQWRAGDRFACNYERTRHTLVKPFDGMRVQSSVNVALYPLESIMQAVHQHHRMLKCLSNGSRAILQAVCCEEKYVVEYEALKGWRKGYGMIRLVEGLDELAEAYHAKHKDDRGAGHPFAG